MSTRVRQAFQSAAGAATTSAGRSYVLISNENDNGYQVYDSADLISGTFTKIANVATSSTNFGGYKPVWIRGTNQGLYPWRSPANYWGVTVSNFNDDGTVSSSFNYDHGQNDNIYSQMSNGRSVSDGSRFYMLAGSLQLYTPSSTTLSYDLSLNLGNYNSVSHSDVSEDDQYISWSSASSNRINVATFNSSTGDTDDIRNSTTTLEIGDHDINPVETDIIAAGERGGALQPRAYIFRRTSNSLNQVTSTTIIPGSQSPTTRCLRWSPDGTHFAITHNYVNYFGVLHCMSIFSWNSSTNSLSKTGQLNIGTDGTLRCEWLDDNYLAVIKETNTNNFIVVNATNKSSPYASATISDNKRYYEMNITEGL